MSQTRTIDSKLLRAAHAVACRNEWSSDDIALVRRMAADGATSIQVSEALGGYIRPNTVLKRAAKLGIKFRAKKAHFGEMTTLSCRSYENGVSARIYRPRTIEIGGGK